jgi:hypothetical protein
VRQEKLFPSQVCLVCPPSHHNLPGPDGGIRHTNMLGKILLHAGKVYGLFAHAATLVWDATTGQLVQQVDHNGGLRFKIALSVDFAGLSLEGRDKVLNVLQEFNRNKN